jgi:hypothetical protein
MSVNCELSRERALKLSKAKKILNCSKVGPLGVAFPCSRSVFHPKSNRRRLALALWSTSRTGNAENRNSCDLTALNVVCSQA